jgi:hypothetical protein
MTEQRINPLPPNASSIKRTIFCQNSGVPLATLDVLIFEGHLAFLEVHEAALYLHPFYRLSTGVLLKKLEDALNSAQDSGWVLIASEQKRLQLLTSATMFSLGVVNQESPTLPSFPVAAASASRLFALSKFFFAVQSEKLSFPSYHVTKKNENLQWENLKHWLDSAFEVKDAWSKQSKNLEIAEKQRAYSDSLREINSETYRRIDTRKVWKWVEMQVLLQYPAGRVKTFESLFMNGDLEPHEWTVDDVEDLKVAILETCDIGNTITFFINKRLNGILALIRDFYSSFTLLTRVGNGDANKLQDEQQTPQEAAIFDEFDRKASELESLPPMPVRESFTSNALFWKAQAQWNILSRVFKQKSAAQNESSST